MNYENIVEIVELENYFKVNEYLKCGWILLSASVSVAPYLNEGNVKQSIYALGWSKKNGEIQHPSKKTDDEMW